MSEMLLINPRRRKARKSRKSASPAQLRARAKFAAMARARSKGGSKRKRNPIGASAKSAYRRVARRIGRRRRNPIGGLPTFATIIRSLKDAAIMGGGAVAVDMAYARIERMMPANLRRNPTRLDVGDGIKAVATVALGQLLNRATRGLSMKAATGALVVQAHGIVTQLLPATMRLNEFDGLGYAVAAPVFDDEARVEPSMLNEYTGGQTPLLNEYTPAFDQSPLLDGAEEEGYFR